ncbi:DUF2986 domain-containing protein [Shewanella schlegeliana]|uniref:DUF2986 domain-containing protein n=1 Tax=Shewanella schlegeliana TaxID=190308 RepID=A0ABS1SV31_9GAMM|nr:DUF2986 domain-containing protein [Shewanella schlegeliana]MBL4911764.1 DUF2986 domain-containing protein [Shewanella schlegeliana]MCL1110284.1 DUF2986 domain-containing protein [Shewanella schlegeliana]GIU31592.1 hypothetical protein TUM4433_23490 [Shewanella schlegeliana]
MNRKQKMIKKTAKRAKARLNKHTAPTIKKYVSKAERAEQQAKLEAEAAEQATAAETTDAATDAPVEASEEKVASAN